MILLNAPAIKFHLDSYAGQESLENRGSKALWLRTMQISVNMAFHLLLMHCYTATH